MLESPAHSDPNKSCFREGFGAFPTRGNPAPFPPEQEDCVQDNLFSSVAARRASQDRVLPHLAPKQGLEYWTIRWDLGWNSLAR